MVSVAVNAIAVARGYVVNESTGHEVGFQPYLRADPAATTPTATANRPPGTPAGPLQPRSSNNAAAMGAGWPPGLALLDPTQQALLGVGGMPGGNRPHSMGLAGLGGMNMGVGLGHALLGGSLDSDAFSSGLPVPSAHSMAIHDSTLGGLGGSYDAGECERRSVGQAADAQ